MKGRLLFHTGDGKAPGAGDLFMSMEDCGLFVNRSNVTVRGIAFRNFLAREKWSTAIDLRSMHITVENCASTNCSLGFIINGRNNVVRGCWADDVGGGVYVGGENAVVENCRLFKQEHAFWLYNSPGAALTQNTCVANLYSAAAFLYSCENSACRNNSFTFQGNDVLVIEESVGDKGKLKTFDCDYNNYGTTLREQPPGTRFDTITPRQGESFLQGGSKAIVNYTEYKGAMKRFVSMAEWREFSGLDQHTLFADPLYQDSSARDFRLDATSPNRGAGADGATMGALGD